MRITKERLEQLWDENETGYYGLDRDSVRELLRECENLLDEIEKCEET